MVEQTSREYPTGERRNPQGDGLWPACDLIDFFAEEKRKGVAMYHSQSRWWEIDHLKDPTPHVVIDPRGDLPDHLCYDLLRDVGCHGGPEKTNRVASVGCSNMLDQIVM